MVSPIREVVDFSTAKPDLHSKWSSRVELDRELSWTQGTVRFVVKSSSVYTASIRLSCSTQSLGSSIISSPRSLLKPVGECDLVFSSAHVLSPVKMTKGGP